MPPRCSSPSLEQLQRDQLRAKKLSLTTQPDSSPPVHKQQDPLPLPAHVSATPPQPSPATTPATQDKPEPNPQAQTSMASKSQQSSYLIQPESSVQDAPTPEGAENNSSFEEKPETLPSPTAPLEITSKQGESIPLEITNDSDDTAADELTNRPKPESTVSNIVVDTPTVLAAGAIELHPPNTQTPPSATVDTNTQSTLPPQQPPPEPLQPKTAISAAVSTVAESHAGWASVVEDSVHAVVELNRNQYLNQAHARSKQSGDSLQLQVQQSSPRPQTAQVRMTITKQQQEQQHHQQQPQQPRHRASSAATSRWPTSKPPTKPRRTPKRLRRLTSASKMHSKPRVKPVTSIQDPLLRISVDQASQQQVDSRLQVQTWFQEQSKNTNEYSTNTRVGSARRSRKGGAPVRVSSAKPSSNSKRKENKAMVCEIQCFILDHLVREFTSQQLHAHSLHTHAAHTQTHTHNPARSHTHKITLI